MGYIGSNLSDYCPSELLREVNRQLASPSPLDEMSEFEINQFKAQYIILQTLFKYKVESKEN